MAPANRIGSIRIAVDGHWDIADLLSLSESLSESYGLFYPLVAPDSDVRDYLHDQLRQIFWSGNIETRRIGAHLYRHIPSEEGLKLRSFSYASPGTMEVAGVIACVLMLAKVSRAWIQTADEFIDLWGKVEKFFEERKTLRRPKREFELDDDMVISSDEAKTLVFAIGEKLGFDAISCDTLITIIGNPIAALKYLVATGAEGRKLAKLQQNGLLHLPEAGDEVTTILKPEKTPPKKSGGVIVVKKRNRPSGARPPTKPTRPGR